MHGNFTSAALLFSSHPENYRRFALMLAIAFLSLFFIFDCVCVCVGCMAFFLSFSALVAGCRLQPYKDSHFSHTSHSIAWFGIVVDYIFNTFVHHFITFRTSISFRNKNNWRRATIPPYFSRLRFKRKTLFSAHDRLRQSVTFARQLFFELLSQYKTKMDYLSQNAVNNSQTVAHSTSSAYETRQCVCNMLILRGIESTWANACIDEKNERLHL